MKNYVTYLSSLIVSIEPNLQVHCEVLALLGPSWAIMSLRKTLLGPSWSRLDPSWSRLEAILGRLGTMLGPLGASMAF